MNDINGLVAETERDLKAARERYESAKLESSVILETVRKSGRPALSPDEAQRFDRANEAGKKAKQEVSDLEEKLVRARVIQSQEAESDRLAAETRDSGAPKP